MSLYRIANQMTLLVLEAIAATDGSPKSVAQSVAYRTAATAVDVRDHIWLLIGEGVLVLDNKGHLQRRKTSKP
jgi:hypothetical protein